MRSFLFSMAWAALILLGIGRSPATADPAIVPASSAEPYIPAHPVSGQLFFAGSRSMSDLAATWADGFRHVQPRVSTTFSLQGSENVLGRIAAGGSVVGLIDREVSATEEKRVAKANPLLKLHVVTVAYGAVAVIVNRDNPIPGLSLAQLKQLFGQSDDAAKLTWGQFGAERDWAATPIIRIIPADKSRARSEFTALVLGANDRLASAKEYSGHKRIIDEVAANRAAVAFVNYADARTEKIRNVAIAAQNSVIFIPPSDDSIGSGKYPLICPLSLAVISSGDNIKDTLLAEFIRYVLSRNGQQDAIKNGYQPLGNEVLSDQYNNLGWDPPK